MKSDVENFFSTSGCRRPCGSLCAFASALEIICFNTGLNEQLTSEVLVHYDCSGYDNLSFSLVSCSISLRTEK